MTTILEAALQYAGRGWHVFAAPVIKGKTQKIGIYRKDKAPRGFPPNDNPWGCTLEADRIEAMWAENPKAGVGVACGRLSGFWALDVDTPEGHDSNGFEHLRQLEDANGPLPATLMAESPSGSRHYLFAYPGVKVWTRWGSVAPGIDPRGDGGMIVAAPSPSRGSVYRWLNDLPIADAPAWLTAIVTSGCGAHGGSRGHSSSVTRMKVGEAVPAFVKAEDAGLGTLTREDRMAEKLAAREHFGPPKMHEVRAIVLFLCDVATKHEGGRMPYEDWRDCCAALKFDVGKEGFALWVRLCEHRTRAGSHAGKFKSAKDLAFYVWNRNMGEAMNLYTVGTLYDVAKRYAEQFAAEGRSVGTWQDYIGL